MPVPPSNADIEFIAPNLNRRLSGVTSTIVRLVPLQAKEAGVVSFGRGLPDFVPRIGLIRLLALGYAQTRSGYNRVWHARRNVEMLLGLFLKCVMRHRLSLVFTSASQRQHTAYTRQLLRRMDVVIATSKATASYLDVPNTVITHGIDLDDFKPASDVRAVRAARAIPGEFVVGCFGRIRKQKGTDLFVDAMVQLLPAYPQASAVVLGRATESHLGFLHALKNKVRSAGLEQRILFPGEVPVHEIAGWYQALSLYVAPQRWEGFGLTPLEAMGCGVPVVASAVGAFPELIVPGATGQLVEPGKLPTMVAHIEPYLKDPALALAHGANALAHVRQHFDIRREASAILELYRRVQRAEPRDAA